MNREFEGSSDLQSFAREIAELKAEVAELHQKLESLPDRIVERMRAELSAGPLSVQALVGYSTTTEASKEYV